MAQNGYEVEIRELGDAAGAARSAGTQLGRLVLEQPLRSAGAGVPGAGAVAGLGAVAGRWQGEASRWGSAAEAYAADLEDSVATYRRSEAQAEHDFSGLGATLSGSAPGSAGGPR